MNAGQKWTRADDQFLCDEYGCMPVAEMAKVLGRSTKAVRTRMAVLRVNTKRSEWEPVADPFISPTAYRKDGYAKPRP